MKYLRKFNEASAEKNRAIDLHVRHMKRKFPVDRIESLVDDMIELPEDLIVSNILVKMMDTLEEFLGNIEGSYYRDIYEHLEYAMSSFIKRIISEKLSKL